MLQPRTSPSQPGRRYPMRISRLQVAPYGAASVRLRYRHREMPVSRPAPARLFMDSAR